ncbi:methyltransferase domain-containing protein [Cohnella sp. AR92]|uniref:methyltransferase domain-containing protein n=1 Tax=Cohnella sp. AR92 TaxID=648716 RepID=UPI000F8D4688|nr:methyltransferase domain-containing protein [Cohnella sp. AR92]RUS47361.1 methyltransferase domain-containing protein [Cohnella sp. AR92]
MADVSQARAHMPEGTNEVINRRSLTASNKRLAELLRPGLSVLDVGCGSGAITVGMAEAVGPQGEAIGVDVNERLISDANRQHAKPDGSLRFEVADIYALPFKERFDVVTAARVLQWLARPEEALQQIVEAAKTGGQVLVLDYNHEKIAWEPEPPAAFRRFYEQFLKWRADSGMRNGIADELARMFEAAGLSDIVVTVQSETTRRGDPGFDQGAGIGIWAEVAASRGHQLVADGYLTEAERSAAEASYRSWVATEAVSQTMYLLAVEGKRA